MIYFVRHGLSEANIKKVFAGQESDSPLVTKGKKQAKSTAKEIIKKNIKISKIISSPLKRAYETAQIIAQEIGFNKTDITIDNRVVEYDMGNLSGTPWHTITSAVLTNAEGAEDSKVFYDRVYGCIKELSQLPGNILLVSHGGVGRMLETIKENKDISLFYDVPIYPNGSIIKIDWIN